jgi:putative endonuclease
MSERSFRSGQKAGRQQAERQGRWAEALCVLRLRLSGYRIVARRLRTPMGEIDLIARRGKVLAFIEVKARAEPDAALFAVTPRQSARIERAALSFVARHPALATLDMRYDIMVVLPRRWPRHLPDAWRPKD